MRDASSSHEQTKSGSLSLLQEFSGGRLSGARLALSGARLALSGARLALSGARLALSGEAGALGRGCVITLALKLRSKLVQRRPSSMPSLSRVALRGLGGKAQN